MEQKKPEGVDDSYDATQALIESTQNSEDFTEPSQIEITPSTSNESPSASSGCVGPVANGNASAGTKYVYSIGKIAVRYPSVGAEKEFFQATARSGNELAGLTDYKALHKILSDRSNRYLARQLCWVLQIEGVNTYILLPRDPLDFELLVEAVRPSPSQEDIDVVVGVKGLIAGPDVCNSLLVPIVRFDQIYSFDRSSFLEQLQKKISHLPADELKSSAEVLLDRVMQLADNAGDADEHRAINYLAMRYSAIYEKVAEMYQGNYSLTDVTAHVSRLSGVRNIIDVILSFTHRETGFLEKYFVRVDVTEQWPFLVSPLSPYYDR